MSITALVQTNLRMNSISENKAVLEVSSDQIHTTMFNVYLKLFKYDFYNVFTKPLVNKIVNLLIKHSSQLTILEQFSIQMVQMVLFLEYDK